MGAVLKKRVVKESGIHIKKSGDTGAKPAPSAGGGMFEMLKKKIN
jgi:hypothetical protein